MEDLNSDPQDSEAASAPEAGAYGIRIAVNPEPVAERELGTFAVAGPKGEISTVRLSELNHSTDQPTVGALSYSFERTSTGTTLPRATYWSLIASVSLTLLLGIALSKIVYPESNLGLPSWAYYSSLFFTFLVTKTVAMSRNGRLMAMRLGSAVLRDIEDQYGTAPIIDLPQGKLRKIQGLVTLELSGLSRLPGVDVFPKPVNQKKDSTDD